jgi:mannose-6-phosphate isomerase
MFLPSGRVHAIGAGLVLFEIQQNSDTTYRVFDWNRLGLDGKPRPLHVWQSLESINFADFEPAPIRGAFTGAGPARMRPLVNDPLFKVEAWQLEPGARTLCAPKTMQIIGVVTGAVQLNAGVERLALRAGQFALIPASVDQAVVDAPNAATFLRIQSQ